jgi:hypothetical protein
MLERCPVTGRKCPKRSAPQHELPCFALDLQSNMNVTGHLATAHYCISKQQDRPLSQSVVRCMEHWRVKDLGMAPLTGAITQ